MSKKAISGGLVVLIIGGLLLLAHEVMLVYPVPVVLIGRSETWGWVLVAGGCVGCSVGVLGCLIEKVIGE